MPLKRQFTLHQTGCSPGKADSSRSICLGMEKFGSSGKPGYPILTSGQKNRDNACPIDALTETEGTPLYHPSHQQRTKHVGGARAGGASAERHREFV